VGFDFALRCFKAFKFALLHVEPSAMRCTEHGLELCGRKGKAFLSRDMFHHYPQSMTSDELFTTKFGLLSNFMQGEDERQKLDIEIKSASLELCGNLLTLPKQILMQNKDHDDDAAGDVVVPRKRIGPSVYTSSFREFLGACASLKVNQAKLRYTSEDNMLSLLANIEDGSNISATLEPCFDDEKPRRASSGRSSRRHHKTREFGILLSNLHILPNAKQTMFYSNCGELTVRFGLGGDSFVQYALPFT
jgi:hypothetical protein